MNKEDIKNNMIPDEIKDICRSCESNIFAQNKGCAFRSLGNEYCDYVLEATKKYLDKQQELEKYKNIIDKAVEYINENKHLSMFADCREPEEDWNYDLEINPRDLLNILKGSDE